MPSHVRADVSENLRLEKAPRSAVATDWTAYASAYDLLSDYNPAYQELVQLFEATLAKIEPPKVIFDLGGGTGNYTEVAARMCPKSEVHMVEPDAGMLRLARSKLSEHANVTFHNRTFEHANDYEKADLVVCAHALYTMPDQQERLIQMRNLLRSGGLLFLIDLGRLMDVGDWRRYLFSEISQRFGILHALRVFWRGREIATQNKAILRSQQNGTYWTHSEAEIAAAVTASGFEITEQKTVYRGYSNFLLCRAAP